MNLLFIRAGKVYQLNTSVARAGDIDYPIYLVGTVGFGLSPSHQIVQRGPMQQGDTYVGFRLDPRILQLPIVVPATSPEDSFSKRARLAQLFRLGDDVVTLRLVWTDSTGTYNRQIDGHVYGQLNMDTDSKFDTIRTAVQIKANDPTWYDTAQQIVALTSTQFGTPTPYPKIYSVTYGAQVVDKQTTINYTGSWDAYPVIQITGPFSTLVISDTLGHQISFNTAIPAGALWTVNLNYGVYTVLDQNGNNKFSALTASSDPINFRIFAESPLVPDGVNTISVSGTGTTVASSVQLYYYQRFVGV